MPVSIKVLFRRHLPILRIVALGLLFIAMARPQSTFKIQNINSDGIDIILCTDLSKSMEKDDFKPNRLVAARKVALEFVDHRPGDRIGLVVFSGESFTLCPLTYDHEVLKNSIRAGLNDVLLDGTAIGMGLATSVDRLRESKSKSKVIILLTDGANNRGQIDPISAAEIAAKYKIKVYTIGMSGLGVTKLNIPVMGDSEIDEDLMKKIASMTSGKYYRAIDNNKLTQIYEEINRLEKSTSENKVYSQRNEMYHPWVILALLLLSTEFILRQTYLKSIT